MNNDGTIKKTVKKLRDFRIQKSIVFPIVLLLLLIGVSLLLAGYLINRSVFYTVFEERESKRARDTHLAINSMVSQEVVRISELAKILRNDTDIVYGMFYYNESGKNTQPLKLAMNQLFPRMNLSFFVMADVSGNVLHRAGGPKNTEPENLAKSDIYQEALKGEMVVATASDAETTSVVVITPIYVFGKNRPSGVLILGFRVDDAFAEKIARETNEQALIALPGKVIAGSDASLRKAFDPRLAQASLKQQKLLFRIDKEALRSYAYVPLTIVDKDFCLLIESDVSVIRELLTKNQVKTVQWGLILLVCIASLGAVLAFLIIYPLNGLYQKALDTIQEYSGGSDLDLPLGGNEISTLVRANDIMLETIKNHLAERTQAEEAFHETSGTLHALIEASPLAIMVVDANGLVRMWNQAAVRMFGWSASETIGRPNPLFSKGGTKELWEIRNRVANGENISNKEARINTSDGSVIILEISAAPLLDAQGKISSVMSILSDITESRKAEEALLQSEERLAQSMKMEAVGKLAENTAHDFNDLLSVITKSCEFLMAHTEGNQARKEIERILIAWEHAATLTRQLLVFSRRQSLKPELLRIDDVVKSQWDTLHHMINESVKFVMETDAELWPVRVDQGQIEQVLATLCMNTLDAIPSSEGRILVRTKNITLRNPFVERDLTIPPGRYATLSVTDNGAGISKESLTRIFASNDGTGLGLGAVYEIVKQSGGYIRVSSVPGEGNTFTVYFPAAEVQ